jgi:hypothetical protein
MIVVDKEELHIIDRANNVFKLVQGEFVVYVVVLFPFLPPLSLSLLISPLFIVENNILYYIFVYPPRSEKLELLYSHSPYVRQIFVTAIRTQFCVVCKQD